jgi:hypothetical protein
VNSFETALLEDLRQHVAERSVPRRRRGRLVGAVVGLAAAGAVAAALVVGGSPARPAPAYAVSVSADGRIHVEVDRLSDAAGLERALAAQGVTADVTYLAPGTACRAPRDGRMATKKARGRPLEVVTRDDGFDLTVSPFLADPTLTLVVEVGRTAQGGALLVTTFVTLGPVGPCVPQPWPGQPG